MLYCLNPIIKINDDVYDIIKPHWHGKLKRFNNFNALDKNTKNIMINYKVLKRCDFYPCKKCNLCLNYKRFDWVLRALNEWHNWENHYFITLTFDEEHYKNFWFEKKFLSTWIKKKLKKTIGQCAYIASQEFGETTFRKHYHLILFTNYEFDDMQLIKRSKRNNSLYTSQTLNNLWKYGSINQINLISSVAEIKYTCSYSIKALRQSKFNKKIPAKYEGEKLIISRGFGNKLDYKSNVDLLPKSLIKNSDQRLYIAERKFKANKLSKEELYKVHCKEEPIQQLKKKIKKDNWDIEKYNQILLMQLNYKQVKRKTEI